MKILITGSDGFIGKHLCLWFLKHGVPFESWKDDILRLRNFHDHFDVVIHLAAVSSPHQFTDSQINGFTTNVTGTQAVLNYCARVGAGIVFSSTCGVYPRLINNVALSEKTAVSPANDYAMSKWLAETLCFEESDESHIPYAVLRLFNVYGIGQPESFILPFIVKKLSENQPVILKTPYSIRDFVNVSDVVTSINQAALFVSSGGKGVFNIGTGAGISILDVACTVEKSMKKIGKIHLEKNAEGHKVDVVIADISEAKRLLNWTPEIELNDGLRLMINENINSRQR